MAAGGDKQRDKYTGALLGLAVGDALGLAVEGMSRAAITRRYGSIDRFRILEDVGYVSDDTEQTALLLGALLAEGDDLDRCVRAFRCALRGWFLRFPWGAGRSTLVACVRITLGLSNTGRPSAGNGSAMRAPALALRFPDDDARRVYFGKAMSRVTHSDPRAVEGALYVAELTTQCLMSDRTVDRQRCVGRAMGVVRDARLKNALQRASAAAEDDRRYSELPRTGYVVDTVAAATAEFLRHGADPHWAIRCAVNAGGDSDTIAAIVGAWVGALHGASALPEDWIETLEDGPFGKRHLVSLAEAALEGAAPPPVPVVAALGRSLALGPLLLWHAVVRRLPLRKNTLAPLPTAASRETVDMPSTLDPELTDAERRRFASPEFDDDAEEP